MADLVNFSVTRSGTQSVSLPKATISCQVVDSTTGALIADLTGANAIVFPAALGNLSASDKSELADLLIPWLIKKVAGL